MGKLFDYIGEVVGLVIGGTGLAIVCALLVVFAPIIALFTVDN